MIYVIIYIIGFILTLTFLKLFGKRMEIDYDPPHKPDHDDWQNNAQAYLGFSLTWVAVAPIFTVAVIVKLLYKFTQWFLKYPNF